MRSRMASAAAWAAALSLAVPVAAQAAGRNDGGPRDPRAQAFVKAVRRPRAPPAQAAGDRRRQRRHPRGHRHGLHGVGGLRRQDAAEGRLQAEGHAVQLPVLGGDAAGGHAPRPAAAEDLPLRHRGRRRQPRRRLHHDGLLADKSVTGAKVVPTTDVTIPPAGPGTSTSGCEASDYPAAVKGAIALIQRGTCAFVDKAAAAQAAGAAGAIIFNDGANADRQNPVFISDAVDLDIPVVVSSFAVGKELYDAYQAGRRRRSTSPTYGVLRDRYFDQVLAETQKGDPDHVAVVGAHLDSVEAGPGINDDGSGTATLLTMAQQIAKSNTKLAQKIRFGWWGGEEEGLIGSTYYAKSLPQSEADKIDVMLDFDMLASPNYVRFVYDGDGSTGDNPAGPPGSGTVESVFHEWFAAQRQADDVAVRRPLGLRRLHRPRHPRRRRVRRRRGHQDAAQERVFGGAAGSWYDPCYHQACDDITTVLTGVPPLEAGGLESAEAAQKMRGGSRKSQIELGAAAAYATWYFGAVKDPFGTGASSAKIAKAHASKAARTRAKRQHDRYRGPIRIRR